MVGLRKLGARLRRLLGGSRASSTPQLSWQPETCELPADDSKPLRLMLTRLSQFNPRLADTQPVLIRQSGGWRKLLAQTHQQLQEIITKAAVVASDHKLPLPRVEVVCLNFLDERSWDDYQCAHSAALPYGLHALRRWFQAQWGTQMQCTITRSFRNLRFSFSTGGHIAVTKSVILRQEKTFTSTLIQRWRHGSLHRSSPRRPR